jgi:hypothetical protein
MIATLLGTAFRAIARLTHGDAGRDLDHVGAELVRLDRPKGVPSTTAR